jgi:hypothetical protein
MMKLECNTKVFLVILCICFFFDFAIAATNPALKKMDEERDAVCGIEGLWQINTQTEAGEWETGTYYLKERGGIIWVYERKNSGSRIVGYSSVQPLKAGVIILIYELHWVDCVVIIKGDEKKVCGYMMRDGCLPTRVEMFRKLGGKE